MQPFMQEDIHDISCPPNTLGNFLTCFEVCKLFLIQYYDESSVLFLIYAFDDNLPEVWSTQTWGLLVNIGQQFWRYLVSSPKFGSTTHVYISSRKSYFGNTWRSQIWKHNPCLLVICDLALLEVCGFQFGWITHMSRLHLSSRTMVLEVPNLDEPWVPQQLFGITA